MVQNWAAFIIGLWVMLSPWFLGFSNIEIMKWSNAVCGLAIVLINAWMLFGKERADHEKQEK
jgi:hypothetical protein